MNHSNICIRYEVRHTRAESTNWHETVQKGRPRRTGAFHTGAPSLTVEWFHELEANKDVKNACRNRRTPHTMH